MAEAALTSSERVNDAKGEIVVRSVSKSYGYGRFATSIVKDCSFTIEPNKFTVMIGPSGVGKSTLIRLIAGFEKPTRGEILASGQPIRGPSKDRLVVFQETALFPWMTTANNVLYGPAARGEANAETRILANFLLDRVGLRTFSDRYPSQLSGGMQRRAELARALINSPDVMLLDEPFRGLDAMTKKLMLEYFAKLCEDGQRTNFFVTTDIDEAIFLADRLIIMSHRPTKVRANLEVDLPRPRDYASIFRNDRANAIKLEALMILHEEAMKAFAGGSSAAADFIEAFKRRSAAA